MAAKLAAACLLMGAACLQGPMALAQDTRVPTTIESPRYPVEARRYGIEGVSLVGALVNEAGVITRMELLKSAGFNLLDAEAIRVVRRARFSPVVYSDGVARSTWFRVPIRFRIEGLPESTVASDAVPLVPEQPDDTEQPPTAVSITPDGLMYLGSRPMGLEDLQVHLKGLAEKQQRVSIQVRADEDAPYGRVARVIAAAQSAGVADIRFLVVPPK